MRPWAEISGARIVQPPRRAPRVRVQGKEEFAFHIGYVASALGRSPETLHEWERRHIFPPAPFRAPGPRKDRLYPVSYVEGIIEIAQQEGILDGRVGDFRTSPFSDRVWALFLKSGFNAPLPDGRVRR